MGARRNTKRHKRLGFWKMSGIKGRSGRRPGDTATLWADALRVAVSREDVDGRKKLARLAERCVEAALGGDMQAIKEIGDRLDGKPRQSMDMTTAARKPIREMTDEEIAERIAELEAQSADASEEGAEAESAPPVTR
jgi:hypothetical protein